VCKLSGDVPEVILSTRGMGAWAEGTYPAARKVEQRAIVFKNCQPNVPTLLHEAAHFEAPPFKGGGRRPRWVMHGRTFKLTHERIREDWRKWTASTDSAII
jgi:hypothetical protein